MKQKKKRQKSTKKTEETIDLFAFMNEGRPSSDELNLVPLDLVHDCLTSTLLLELATLDNECRSTRTIARILELMVSDDKADPLIRLAAQKFCETMTSDDSTWSQ